jgi:hypothetical protein
MISGIIAELHSEVSEASCFGLSVASGFIPEAASGEQIDSNALIRQANDVATPPSPAPEA